MASWLNDAERNAEDFVQKNTKFQEITDQVFTGLSRSGKLEQRAAAEAVDFLFSQLDIHLVRVGIAVKKPSPDEVTELFQTADLDKSSYLDQKEFQAFYAKVVVYAAKRAAGGFAKSYGLGILGGIVCTMLLKKTIKSIPVVGLVASPFLGLLPTILIGPTIGAAATYIIRKEGISTLKKRLFGKGPKNPGQFKTG